MHIVTGKMYNSWCVEIKFAPAVFFHLVFSPAPAGEADGDFNNVDFSNVVFDFSPLPAGKADGDFNKVVLDVFLSPLGKQTVISTRWSLTFPCPRRGSRR